MEAKLAANKILQIEDVLTSLDDMVSLIAAFTNGNQDIFTKLEDILPIVEDLTALDLDMVTEDLTKGTFFGNRKIDIDLALNRVGIASLTDFNAIMDIWTTTEGIVYYSGAEATFIDGIKLTINFTNNSGQPEVVSTHGGIVDQLEDSIAFQTKIKNTSIQEAVGGKSGSIISITDVVGSASNLEELKLIVNSGLSVELAPLYYWAKTTSALQVVADKMGHVSDLLDSIVEITLVSGSINEIFAVGAAIDAVLGVYAKLSEMAVVHANILNINTVASDMTHINAVAGDLSAIDAIVLNLNAVKTTALNISNINTLALDSAKINTLVSNITALQMVYSNITSVNTVSANIGSITAVNNNISHLLPLSTYINELRLIAQDIDAVIRAGDNVDLINASKDAAIAASQSALASKDAAIVAKDTAQLSASQASTSEANAQSYATSASNAMIDAALSKSNALASASAADVSAQFSSDAADRAEMALNNVASISLIPLWTNGSNYGNGTQVIDPSDAEIYLCIDAITGSLVEPHLDNVHFKRILGVSFSIDGGYASVATINQIYDGGNANG